MHDQVAKPGRPGEPLRQIAVDGIRHRSQILSFAGQPIADASKVTFHGGRPLGQNLPIQLAHQRTRPASTPSPARRMTASASHQKRVASSTNAS